MTGELELLKLRLYVTKVGHVLIGFRGERRHKMNRGIEFVMVKREFEVGGNDSLPLGVERVELDVGSGCNDGGFPVDFIGLTVGHHDGWIVGLLDECIIIGG